jgi:hypothetical protein
MRERRVRRKRRTYGKECRKRDRWQQPTTFEPRGRPYLPTSERSPEGEDHSVVATLVRLARPSNHPLFL